jgi:hypothetical protein
MRGFFGLDGLDRLFRLLRLFRLITDYIIISFIFYTF